MTIIEFIDTINEKDYHVLYEDNEIEIKEYREYYAFESENVIVVKVDVHNKNVYFQKAFFEKLLRHFTSRFKKLPIDIYYDSPIVNLNGNNSVTVFFGFCFNDIIIEPYEDAVSTASRIFDAIVHDTVIFVKESVEYINRTSNVKVMNISSHEFVNYIKNDYNDMFKDLLKYYLRHSAGVEGNINVVNVNLNSKNIQVELINSLGDENE